MTEKRRPSISELLADHALITAAIGRGVREALLKHAQAKQLVAIGQNGKVVWVPAEEVLARLSREERPQASEA